MITKDHHTLVGVFTEAALADQTRADLLRAGFRPEQIELNGPGAAPPAHPINVPAGLRTRGKAAIVALVGGVVGALICTLLATGAFRGFGPLTGHIALDSVIGAVGGFVLGAVIGALVGGGFAAADTGFYAQEVRAGQTVLKVHANGRSAEAEQILRRNQASRVETSDEAPAGPLR